MIDTDASIRSQLAAIIGVACLILSGEAGAGRSGGQTDPFREDFSSGRLDWENRWDTNSGNDSYTSYYRVDRLSPGFLVSDRQSYYSHSVHDYFHEQVVQALKPTSDSGFWDSENACWAGLLLWSPVDGWYAATLHDWRFSVELQEGALMASILSGSHPMDEALKDELFYIHKRIDGDGTIAGLSVIGGTNQGAYEYGLVLSAMALGARYFMDSDGPVGDRAYEDMRKVFLRINGIFSERMTPCEEGAVMLRGFVNAYSAFVLHGDTPSARIARNKFETMALRLVESQKSIGAFEMYDGNLHVQKQLKADIALLLAYEITNDQRYVDAVKRNMQWMVTNRWDRSAKCMGGVTWAEDDSNTFFECHQLWFILVAQYLEDCSEFSYRPYLEDAFAFLTDDNCAGVDLYEHNAETYGPFFSYRAFSRDGTIQKEPFHQWKGGYEIGASLWALASIYDVYTEGHSRLVTQAPEDSSGSWDKAIFTARNFGNGDMSFRWNVQFRDVRFPGAYTGLFRSQANDQLLLLDTTTGLSYRTLAGIRYVLVDRALLRSGVVYTVAYEKRGKDDRIRVMLLADKVALFDDYISNMREFDSCYFGVFQNNGGALSARAIFVDNIEYAPVGDNAGLVPEASCLYQGYPNPFNARVCIEYDVAASGPVSLRVYNAAGEIVADLARGVAEPGRYSAIWDGRDRSGAEVASGVYFCSFVTPETKQSRKLVLVR